MPLTAPRDQQDAAAQGNPYSVPDKLYRYDAKHPSNKQPDEQDLELINKYSDFDEATETLTPHKPLKTILLKICTSVFKCTLDFDNMAKQIQKAEATPNYVNKSVHTKTSLNTPSGATDYPALLPIFKGLSSAMDALNQSYHREGTRLITLRNKAHLQLCRLARVDHLADELISRMAVYHVSYFRRERQDTSPTSSKPTLSDKELATTVVYALLKKLDQDTLQFLDINRDALLKTFLKRHKPVDKKEIPIIDHQIMSDARITMLGYIKHVTVYYCKNKKEVERKKSSAAAVAAQIERDNAQKSHSAAHAVIQDHAASLPKDHPTLTTAVKHIVNRQNNRQTGHQKVRFNGPDQRQKTGTAKRKAAPDPASKRQRAKTVKGPANHKSPAAGQNNNNGARRTNVKPNRKQTNKTASQQKRDNANPKKRPPNNGRGNAKTKRKKY